MNDIDQKIQAALRRASTGDALAAEPNIAEEVMAAFRGHHRWLSALFVVVQIVASVALVLTAVRFYQATEVTAQLRWGAGSIVLFLVITMLKIWFWLELHTNRVLREVKRVELLLITRPPG